MFFLDERSYRTQSADEASSPCRDSNGKLDNAPTMPQSDRADLGYGPANPACIDHVNDPSRTMLGAEQLQWIENGLLKSKAKWKLVMNEVVISQLFVIPYDRWDGYPAERTALLQFIADHHIKNVVFLTTDIHANFASRVYVDITKDPQPVAYEIATGPIQTCTLKCEIETVTSQGAGELFKNFLISHHLIDVDCVNFDSYGYDDVVIPSTGRSMTNTFKTDEPAPGGGGKIMTDTKGNSPRTCQPITLKSGELTPSH
jgi:phosphodiesterase/alkaline phosphatase D-like protein